MIPHRTPLKTAELDRLANYLDARAVPHNGMSLEMLDGYLHAVVIGPEMILPSEWLPYVWSGEPVREHTWATKAEAEEILGLMMQHMNSIAAALRTGEGDWAPLIEEYSKRGKPASYGQEWALGFLRGVELRTKLWQPLRDDPDRTTGWVALGLLAFGPGDPAMKKAVRTQAQRDRLMEEMLDFVEHAAVYWLERYTPPEPVRRSSPKVGRNDPCPCGSGRKYKHCCGRTVSVH